MGEPALRQPPPKVTVDEFLAWDDGTDVRYELIGGEIVAMTPPSPAHSKIAARLTAMIQRALQPPCDVYVEAGIRLTEKADAYYQADLAVSCTPLKPNDTDVPEPIVIVEVLSPSTAAHDRATKLPDYRTIPTVREIALVSATAMKAELWHRAEGGWTVNDLEGAGAVLGFESLGIEVPLATVYEGVAFKAESAEAETAGTTAGKA